MRVRDGVNRRQVAQLKAALKSGARVDDIAGTLNVQPEVVFKFAKSWNIKVADTPATLRIRRHESFIEEEVMKRMAAKETADREGTKEAAIEEVTKEAEKGK